MRIAISIVSFNAKDHLRKCLNNILTQKTKHQLEVWLVDNASEEKIVEMIKAEFPQIRLTENSKNLGFAKAHNQNLKKIKADFVLVANYDLEMPENSIEKMTEFMQTHPDCGIASCRLTYPDGRLQSNGGDLPFGLALFSWLFNLEVLGNLPNFHGTDENYYKSVREIGWVGGTFMLIRSEVLEKLAGFKEDYFMYFEDVEFCFRVKSTGFKIMINPSIEIKHIGGASSKDPKLRQWSGEMKGLIIFYREIFGVLGEIYVRLLIYLSTFLRIIAFASLGRFNISKTYGKVFFSI